MPSGLYPHFRSAATTRLDPAPACVLNRLGKSIPSRQLVSLHLVTDRL